MKDELLPIGSIVDVNGVDLMIAGYIDSKLDIEGEHYHYACFPYPTGLSEQSLLVNKNKITRVKFLGFQDNRFAKLKIDLEKHNE